MSLLVNTDQAFARGDHRSFALHEGTVDYAEIKKNDNIASPSRYIRTGNLETYRPLEETMRKLYGKRGVEQQLSETNKALNEIMEKLTE